MEILVARRTPADGCTIGQMFVAGRWQAWTMEDTVRAGPKVPGETAIPAGRYRVSLFRSPHFGWFVPLLHDVPGFSMVEIHPGNTSRDTAGCILVGFGLHGVALTNSRLAFDALVSMIAAAVERHEDVSIQIVNAPEAAPLHV
jgi:hypothetical protein